MSDMMMIDRDALRMLADAATMGASMLPPGMREQAVEAVYASREMLRKVGADAYGAPLYRVRRAADGAYLYGSTGLDGIHLGWWDGLRMAGAWPESQARRMAGAVRALTNATDIELEPARAAGEEAA
jgi:hypothetical protein